MSAYTTTAAISAKIPPQFLTQALDDDGDGQPDEGLLTQIIANACTTIDGRIGSRFTTPLQNPIPALIADAALTLVCSAIYRRRNVSDDKNPFAVQEAAVLGDGSDDNPGLLGQVAAGKLLPADRSIVKPAAVVISEPAKTTSRAGRSVT